MSTRAITPSRGQEQGGSRGRALFLFVPFLWLLHLPPGISASGDAATPELPREYIDTSIDPAYDRPANFFVGAGGDLQAALMLVQPGQILELEAGAVFTGNFKLPVKEGRGWIYIRSSEYRRLPSPGRRVGPQHSRLMPRIVSPNSLPALFTIYQAHHYRFIGIEISTDVDNYNLVLLGYGLDNVTDPMWRMQRADTVDEYPQHITFDRCYIHSTSEENWARTGIFGDGKYIALVDSHLSNFKDTADAQAFKAAQAPGPYKLRNNYLEATGENVMFGGESAGVLTDDVLSADIEIRGNHFRKRWDWCDLPSCSGVDNWTIKNLLEFKQGIRILVSGNVFENNWLDAQIGRAIVITPANQTGNMPWTAIQDLTMEHNIIRHAGGGIVIRGGTGFEAPDKPTRQTQRVLIRNNIIQNISRCYAESPRLIELFISADQLPILDLEISHNLFLFEPGEIGYLGAWVSSPEAAENVVFDNNILQHGDYGLKIQTLSGNLSFQNNAIIRMPGERDYDRYRLRRNFEARYGRDNFNVDGISGVGFTNHRQGDYRLRSTSRFKNAGTDGTDLGPDSKALRMSRRLGRRISVGPSEQAGCGREPKPSRPGHDPDRGALGTRWPLFNGPGTVTFADTTARTTADFNATGTYTLLLEATDGAYVARRTRRIPVLPPPVGDTGETVGATGRPLHAVAE